MLEIQYLHINYIIITYLSLRDTKSFKLSKIYTNTLLLQLLPLPPSFFHSLSKPKLLTQQQHDYSIFLILLVSNQNCYFICQVSSCCLSIFSKFSICSCTAWIHPSFNLFFFQPWFNINHRNINHPLVILYYQLYGRICSMNFIIETFSFATSYNRWWWSLILHQLFFIVLFLLLLEKKENSELFLFTWDLLYENYKGEIDTFFFCEVLFFCCFSDRHT